jgi:acetyltransferase
VVLKLHSETITHKTDVGGVQLNLKDEAEVHQAFSGIKASVTEAVGAEHFLGVTVQQMSKLDGYELILGSSNDPQFGPVILFGMGGQLVEVFKDRSLALPPLNSTLARRLMERTKIYTALQGVRGRKPVDMKELEQLLVRFSQLIVEQPWIKELDINPLLASPDRLLALDARVVVYEKDTTEAQLPKLAIRPYPSQYTWQVTTRTGKQITIRPIRAEDEPKMIKFHETLSDRTVFMRYMSPLLLNVRAAHARLARICHCDYDRELTLIAVENDDTSGDDRILGACRMSKMHGVNVARFSLLVSDISQGAGVGSELLQKQIQVAKAEKLIRLEAVTSPDNLPMRKLLGRLGFEIKDAQDGKMVKAGLDLI